MNRSRFLSLVFLFAGYSTLSMANTSLLYIATQNPERMGVMAAEFDSDNGTLSTPRMAIETRDPAHFTLSASGKHLYLCNTGTPGGVSAFEVDRKSGGLRLLNYRPSPGRGPSYISVDRSGRYVLDANYGGGFVEVHALNADGSLGEQTAFVQHAGSSVHPQRQTKPYAHWFHTDPSNKFALATDLGIDQVVIYRFASGKLTPNQPPATTVKGGMGPRHLVFHPSGKWVYGIAELANEVMAFDWDARGGTLTPIQSVKTLADDFPGTSTAAEIAVHANGRFLYASNRGEDSLVVYSIDAKTGQLTFSQRASSRGKVPRYFTFDTSNKWLVVSNQESASLAVFAVDPKSGALTPKGDPVAVVKPMAVVFAPR